MNIVPQDNYRSSISTQQSKINSNAIPSLPDTFRNQLAARPLNTQLNDRHPLEGRITNWEETQYKRQLEQYRQIFGVAEPIKRVMELKIVEQSDFNPLNSTNIHRDILLNKDASIDWEDIYREPIFTSATDVGDNIHAKIERKIGI